MPREPDHDAIKRAWQLKREKKSQEEIGEAIGLQSRQVGNYLSIKWLEKRGLRHLRSREKRDQELGSQCQGAHPWMRPGSQFEGYGFAVVTGEESPEATEADPPPKNEAGRPIIRRTYTCVSCGYRRVERKWAVLV